MKHRGSIHIIVAITLYVAVQCNALPRGNALPRKGGEEYITCHSGSLNVILAAPHGGYNETDDIRDRDAGCYVDGQCVWSHDCGEKDFDECDATTVRDSYTQELTWLIHDNLMDATGKMPSMVINGLSRVKLDANREINEATFGETVAVEAWEEFHRCINASKQTIEADENVGGMGLFIDLHGHGHPNDWAELGYLLSGSELDSDDFVPEDTSIVHLSTQVQVPFNDLLRGPVSFGHFLEEEGFWTVPSPGTPGPDGESYFSGGYNTRIHGSNEGGKVDSIQIESAFVNRDDPMRAQYALAISNTIIKYLEANYPAPSV